MVRRSWGFVEYGADFMNLDTCALADHDEDLGEFIERAQAGAAIAVVTEACNTTKYTRPEALPFTLSGRPELGKAWVTATKDEVKCVGVGLSVDGGKTYQNALGLVPRRFWP